MKTNSKFTDKCLIDIPAWLNTYCEQAHRKGFVVGLSGGIDSAVTSTLCALTGKPTVVVTMPIGSSSMANAEKHMRWLLDPAFDPGHHFDVTSMKIDLTNAALALKKALPVRWEGKSDSSALVLTNTYPRLRMSTLYAIATDLQMLVCGTGNKVEDFGVGFFTKYGDGGVDISPLGDLLKSQVYEIGEALGLVDEIIEAVPTDGLWEDGRTDEDQLGATYDELGWAMDYSEKQQEIDDIVMITRANELLETPAYADLCRDLTDRETEVLKIYKELHAANEHKIKPIPVFKLNKYWKKEG